MIKVKICGITNLKDALSAMEAGADYLGFIFTKKSKRYIAPEVAGAIIKALSRRVLKVGVFVDEDPRVVKKIAAACKLDYLQFHGREDVGYLRKFSKFKVIRAIRVKNKSSFECLKEFTPRFFLFDTFKKNISGGTGSVFDWRLLGVLKGLKTPFFVSGGLTPRNVAGLLKKVHPFGVDVSSGVEKSPGVKDHKLIKEFIEKAKSCDKNEIQMSKTN